MTAQVAPSVPESVLLFSYKRCPVMVFCAKDIARVCYNVNVIIQCWATKLDCGQSILVNELSGHTPMGEKRDYISPSRLESSVQKEQYVTRAPLRGSGQLAAPSCSARNEEGPYANIDPHKGRAPSEHEPTTKLPF
jgi:hypothetical protein